MNAETAPERWVDARWVLPRPENLPVEVQMQDGRREVRRVVEGSWRQVKQWRKLEQKAK